INTFQEATDFVGEKVSGICREFSARLRRFEVNNGTTLGQCPFSPREPVHDAFVSGDILPGLGDNPDYGRQITERASSVFYSEQIAAETRPWEQETALGLSSVADQTLQASLCISGTLLHSWEDVYTGGQGGVRWTRYLDARTSLSRIFPGITMPTEQSRNFSIDARLSQAYVQTVSPQKDVVIVVDITMVTHQSVMRQAMSVLLHTLSPWDKIAVIINGDLQFSQLQQVTLPFPVSDLLDKMTPHDLSPEDTKSALQAGVAALQDSSACIKAVLYLTDHTVNMETVQSVLEVLSEDIQIFTYTFNPSINPRILQHLACATNGSWEPITDDVTMVTRLTRYYGMHHPLNGSAARWTTIVPDSLSAGNLSSCCCAVPRPATYDPLQSLFGVLCVDLSVNKLQQAGASDVNVLENKASVVPACPVQRYTREELDKLRPEESKCSRLEVTTAGQLRGFIEQAVRTTAGALETAAQVVKLLPTCPYINTQYDSCTNTTPGMVPDQRYHQPISNGTSNIHLTDQARVIYRNTSDSNPYKALLDSLCVSSSAEIDWLSVFQQNSGARWQFFIDSPTGYTRLYPSVNDLPESCQEGGGVDPRSQSWYAGMTSPAKDVAIIVDPALDDSLDIMKAAAKLAVNTVSKYDTGQLMVARQQLQSGGFQQGTETNRQTWLETVDRITSPTHSTTQDLISTIKTAIGHFKDKHQEEDTKCFPVLLLLTNRHLDLTVLYETAQENTPHLGVRVFTFTFGQLADDPVAKQLACDSKGSWAMVKTMEDLHLVREYYGMLSPGEHVGNVLWSEAHNFMYDGDIRGTTGCLPVYNVSSEYLSLLGLSCVHVDEIDLQGLTDGQAMFSELTASSTKQCPTTPFDEEDVQKLRRPQARCPARISVTAAELRGLAEQAVKQAAEEFEIGYVVAQQTPGICPFTGEFYDTCKKRPQSFQRELQFQREVSRKSPAFHLPYSVDVTVGEETGLQDFINNQTLYQSLCASLGMDSTWEVTLQQSQYIAWQFYGDQASRFLRIYPALKETQEQCSNKMTDLPIRTWFSSAASSPKDVIIILDPHYSENLSLLKTTATALIATLTRFDFANILTTSGQQFVSGMLRAYGNVRTAMVEFVNQANVVGDTDLRRSFVSVQGIVDRALQSSNTTHCVTAVVLITDFVVAPSVLEHLRGKAFRVFTYTVGPWSDRTNAKRASCENMGTWTHIASLEDVWTKMADYYNYFSMNEKTNNVIWTEPYQDRGWSFQFQTDHPYIIKGSALYDVVNIIDRQVQYEDLVQYMEEAKDKLAWLQNATGTHAKVRPTNFTCTSTNFPRYFKSGMNSAAPDGDDCADILQKSGGKAKSGIYVIKPHGSVELHGIRVLCHMEDGRGWTIIQRRRNNRESFYRKWSTYEQGFGHPCGNVWLGNRHIYQLTHQKQYTLQIYMMGADGKKNFANYDSFLIEGEEENYKLRLGSFSGSCNLRDAMAIHNNTAFSTLDRDNDNYLKHCANLYKGGWWYGLGEIVSGCLPVYDIQSEFLTLLGVTCLDLTKQRILSFPNDGQEVFAAMQSLSQRRCPASQLTETQIEKIRKLGAKCKGHQVTEVFQGMEDSVRRGVVTAQQTFKLDGQACHGTADLAATDSCDVTVGQRTNSTLILAADDHTRTGNMSPGSSPLYKSLCVSATLILESFLTVIDLTVIENWILSEFADDLAPIVTHLFNASYEEGTVPIDWKSANVVPVPKFAGASKAQDMRPVSLLSVLAKLLERSILKRLLPSIQAVIKDQYAYVKGSSTTLALVRMVQTWLTAVDSNKPTLVRAIFADMSKAFDRVDHARLLQRVIDIHTSPRMQRWIVSYLQNRRQRVVIDGETSSWRTLTSGVPQGGVLSPYLFILFMSTRTTVHIDTMNVGYADDVTLSRTLSVALADQDKTVEDESSHLNSWAEDNKMTLNGGKSLLLQICFSRSVPIPPTITLGGQPVPSVDCAKGLGFLIDKDLTFNEQVNSMISNASRRLHYLRLLTKQGTSVTDLIQIYLALVRPVLEYGHVLLVGCSKEQELAIERVQRRALRIISLGGRRSVPDLPTLKSRREDAAVHLFQRMLQEDHPLHDLVPPSRSGATGRTLRNSSTISNWRMTLEGGNPFLSLPIRHQYFVSSPSELTSHVRVYPGVVMSGQQCTDTGRQQILDTVLYETQNNVGAFLYPKTLVIILHNTRADTKSQMVQTTLDLTNTLSQWDHINIVTGQGTVFSQTSHATEDTKERIRSYLQDVSPQDSDVVNLLHEAASFFEASANVCNGVLFLLSDSALSTHHVSAVNVNATVFVKTFGGLANQESSRTVAMEIACQHGGSWESADVPAGNYLHFFPRSFENVRDPVWFNRSHDFLSSPDSEPVMTSCLPATHGSQTVGFLCAESNAHQLQDRIKMPTQCRRTQLSQDQRETLRRPEAKCSQLSGKGTEAEGTTLGVTPEPGMPPTGMGPGKIIGIVIGCLLIIALVAGPLLWYYKKRHNDRVDGFLRLDSFLTDEIELDGDADEVDSSTTAPLLTNQVE
ncbi:hypothetical protein Bbelb_001650, partial [Branchiostoma belcheri]